MYFTQDEEESDDEQEEACVTTPNKEVCVSAIALLEPV